MHHNPLLRVAVFDFIKPTPHGTTWGLGGTCVNVGCIPKKLMHHTGLLGKHMSDSSLMGWRVPTADGKTDTWATAASLDWTDMVTQVDLYIKSLNFNYVKSLREAKVDYINAYAEFTDPHTVAFKLKPKKRGDPVEDKKLTAERFLIASGGRPKIPEHEGATLGITSDDIFWWRKDPKKTLVVGASYIALECAGFLHEVMVHCLPPNHHQ